MSIERNVLVVRSKTSVLSYQVQDTSASPIELFSNLTSISHSHATLPLLFDSSGKYFANILSDANTLNIQSGTTGEILTSLFLPELQAAEFSPQGNFLITCTRAVKGTATDAGEGNLKIWKVADASLQGSYHQKVYKKDTIQWMKQETICMRMVTNELQILRGDAPGERPLGKLHHKGVSQFKVAPVSTGTALARVIVFTPESGGQPARASIYEITNKTPPSEFELSCEVVNSRTMFSATEADIHWNSAGTHVLVHTHTDVDTSGTSYYGASSLYILSIDGSLSNIVSQSKEGPVYDIQWSPLGTQFVIAAGNMPSHCTLYNEKAEPLYEYGTAHRNTISWSPHGRFLCLAGFGNLAGEMDFYDTGKKNRKLGSNIAHCTIQYGWSPCSRYFMTATLAPRMNVDNGFKLFKYNGFGPIVQENISYLYDAVWRPASEGVFPNRPPSPKKESSEEGVDAAEVKKPEIVKVAAYRPPGSSGFLAEQMKQRDAILTAGKVTTNKTSAPIVPKPVVRLIPGMSPEMAAAAALKQTKAAEKKVKNDKATPTAPKVAPAAPITVFTKPVEEKKTEPLTAVEIDKRLKALRKKLKLIEELDEKKGTMVLNEDQMAKVASKPEVVREIEELNTLQKTMA